MIALKWILSELHFTILSTHVRCRHNSLKEFLWFHITSTVAAALRCTNSVCFTLFSYFALHRVMKISCHSSVPFVSDCSSTRGRETGISSCIQVIKDTNVSIASQHFLGGELSVLGGGKLFVTILISLMFLLLIPHSAIIWKFTWKLTTARKRKSQNHQKNIMNLVRSNQDYQKSFLWSAQISMQFL